MVRLTCAVCQQGDEDPSIDHDTIFRCSGPCNRVYHYRCVAIDPPARLNLTLTCPECEDTRPETYLRSEAKEPPTMNVQEWTATCQVIKSVLEAGGHRFLMRFPQVTWEMFAGISADAIGLRAAGFPLQSVVVERNQACDALLSDEHHCGDALRKIYRYVQQGAKDSVESPGQHAINILKMSQADANNYTVDMLIACGVCTPYTRLGAGLGFATRSGRTFLEVLNFLAKSPVNFYSMEQCVEFTTSKGNKQSTTLDHGCIFQMFLHSLVSLGYEVAWRLHDTSDGGAPQHRERIYLVAILKGGPHPSYLLDIDLAPDSTGPWVTQQRRIMSESTLPPCKQMISLILSQSAFSASTKDNDTSSAVTTASRRLAFVRFNTDGTILSGPYSPREVTRLQELPHNYTEKAASVNERYYHAGNTRSGETSRAIMTGYKAALAPVLDGECPQLGQRVSEFVEHSETLDLSNLIQQYVKSPKNQIRGACTTSEDQWALLPADEKRPPMWPLKDFICTRPIGKERLLNNRGDVTTFTEAEARYLIQTQSDQLQKFDGLLQHIMDASKDKSPIERDRSARPAIAKEHEDFSEWSKIYYSTLE